MRQSRRMSSTEAATNVVIGYILAVKAWIWHQPNLLFGIASKKGFVNHVQARPVEVRP
ncbi:hypothetical protein [Magnetospirillum sp. SS-4]|uniref:DUF7220 family protein n=1 Tax=Magnetospirillum sp. SS-4 TaxID=2681465 RepID=UPI00137FA9CA|nr:hypothetical protein [Magnetospirillum sp. SS-4]CAA7624252.1 hypothetical protein MTBSS4_450014 [Magnetospirillum sp. SS-4]